MSAEAMSWVLDRSKQKGGPFLILLLVAMDCDWTGRTSYSSNDRLARRSRMHPRTVVRELRRMEEAGELVRELLGTGHLPSRWCIPGVERDGYARDKRGGKMPPQGWQNATPGMAKCHPRDGKMPSNKLSNRTMSTLSSKTEVSAPTDKQKTVAADTPTQTLKAPRALADFLFSPPLNIDHGAADRLWTACHAAWPSVTCDDLLVLAREKLRVMRNVKNPAGVIMTSLPAAVLSLKLAMERRRE